MGDMLRFIELRDGSRIDPNLIRAIIPHDRWEGAYETPIPARYVVWWGVGTTLGTQCIYCEDIESALAEIQDLERQIVQAISEPPLATIPAAQQEP
jgi:hypothetical protein